MNLIYNLTFNKKVLNLRISKVVQLLKKMKATMKTEILSVQQKVGKLSKNFKLLALKFASDTQPTFSTSSVTQFSTTPRKEHNEKCSHL